MSQTQPSTNNETPAISVANLEFAYSEGGFKIRIPKLEVAGGEKLTFIGPSGSGKTTLLQLLAGSLEPTVGTVNVGSFSMSDSSEEERRAFRLSNLGMVFQEFELMEALSVKENILLPYLLEPELGQVVEHESEAKRLAEAAGIGGYLERKPRHLSQGERQRVAICRALITNPSVVLADEPTGNLDPKTRENVLELMVSEIEQRNATLIAVTHDHGILDRFDRVIDFSEFLETA